jgi:glycosyltransferase involved in cell wall biosynthesis
MKIGIISTVSAPVRKDSGGSVEAWTWLMAQELGRLGHETTVFGCGGANVSGKFVETLPGPYGAAGSCDDWQLCEWINLCRAVEQGGRFDVLHAQAYLWGVPLQPFSKAPMVHTIHIVPDDNTAHLWRSSPRTTVTALSNHQWSIYPELKPSAVIPHGVDAGQFTFRQKPDDYVLYLGRFTSSKGPMQAIQAARAMGLRLVMAGQDNPYFREKIKPLVDGKSIEYAGFVRGAERDKLMGGARALLYPIQYPESFGLVLVEAMLCGTPIVAMRTGAVPEIVEEGVSGFVAGNAEEFEASIAKCFSLDRRVIREHAEKRFSPEQMAKDYLKVYSKVANQG